ncbi:MAG TPA: alkaline phosphatase family protein [Alphaproteobacteria bacterium]
MKLRHLLLAATLTTALVALPLVSAVRADDNDGASDRHAIKHVVVIFQENVSFDHYFGTYPKALNPAGEPAFNAKPGTPSVNGFTDGLLNSNPNLTNPFRLGRTQVATCDQDHNYTDEQKAFDGGLMDMFVQKVGNGGGGCDPKQVMAYFDGNVVTALWNYAQNFAMSDNSFNTTFGPSTPGALNLISGQTHGASGPSTEIANGSVIGDPQPSFDDCTTRDNVAMSGKNVGDLLNAKGLTWGFFQGGFKPTGVNTTTGKAVCGAFHIGSDGKKKGDYIPHHQPFQYYQQTANPHHLPPTSVAAIGSQDQANHQYDMSDFMAALDAGILPAVSYLKAPGYQDGHAGYSDPLAEQTFVVNVVNRLQQMPQWNDTAIIIAYDDSDGWYDHVMGPIVMQSHDVNDALTGPGSCGTATNSKYQDRCGYGPRLPLLVVSPFAKKNYVDSTVTDQSSILRFVEDVFDLGRIGDDSFDAKAGTLDSMFDFSPRGDRKLVLDASTGQPVSTSAQNND